MSPMYFVMNARNGAEYSYSKFGMVPVMERELERLCEVAADRGYELSADDAGLRLERSQ